MTTLKGKEYLKNRLAHKQARVRTRYEYYTMKQSVHDFSENCPPSLRWIGGTLGWCAKAVDALADRLVFREFEDDYFDFNTIFKMNNPDVFFDSAILSALIGSCSFVYISRDETGFPRLKVIDGAKATGIIDPVTGLLNEGYAVLEEDEHHNVLMDAYFTPGKTVFWDKDNGMRVERYEAAYPLLVPIIHRPDDVRPFGHSRISRSCMELMQSALRTIKRSEVSAEFYSFPQKYAIGVSEDYEYDRWKNTMTSMLVITKDEDGDKPVVGQFNQQSMTPYIEQLRMFASLFAGETGLTVDDLGFVSDNPSSAEAIKSSHENLRLAARSAQRHFGSGFLNVGYLAACIRDNFPYLRSQVYLERPMWEPIFEPDAAMLSGIGDGAIKLNQAVPGYFDSRNLRELTGINAGGK